MPADIDSIMQIEVPLIVRIGRRQMTVREVMDFAPGAIIELPKNADDELDVLVNNREIGLGHAVKVGENFGVRIATVGAISQRIKALGGANSDQDSPGDLESLAAAANSANDSHGGAADSDVDEQPAG